jgi:hypothetical protein
MIIQGHKLIQVFGAPYSYCSTTSTECTSHRWTFRLKSDSISSSSTSDHGRQSQLDTLVTIISVTTSDNSASHLASSAANEHELVRAVANELFGAVTNAATVTKQQQQQQQQTAAAAAAASSCTQWLLHFNTANSDVVLGYLETKVIDILHHISDTCVYIMPRLNSYR